MAEHGEKSVVDVRLWWDSAVIRGAGDGEAGARHRGVDDPFADLGRDRPSPRCSPLRRSLPRLPTALLERGHLEARLDDWAPLSVVRGAPGSGKTTLVTAWLDAQPLEAVTAVWVVAGQGPLSPEGFADQVSRGLAAVGLSPGASPLGGASTAGRAGLGQLDTAIRATSVGQKIVLAIDRFDSVRHEDVLVELIRLTERHRNFHLCVCARRPHPIELVAAGRMRTTLIDNRDLALGVGEIAKLARIMHKPLAPRQAAVLREAIGGSVATVRVLLEATAEDERLPWAAAAEHVRQVVLPGLLDAASLQLLQRLAFPDVVDRPLIRWIGEMADVDRVVAVLESSGLLVRRFGEDSAISYTIPSAIRQALREDLVRDDPFGARSLHQELARWYLERATIGTRADDVVSLALHHAVAGRGWELVEDVWSRYGAVLAIKQPEALRHALNAMPAEQLETRPGMAVAREILNVGVLDAVGDGLRATFRAYFEASERFVDRLETLPLADLLYLGAGHVIGLRHLGRLCESAAFAVRVDRLATELVASQHAGDDRHAWFHLQWGVTRTLLGDPHARFSYRTAWNYGLASAADFLASNAAANLALLHGFDGDSGQAGLWLARRERFGPNQHWSERFVGLGALLGEGFGALDRLEETAVGAVLARLGHGSAPGELWPFVAFLHAQHALHFGEVAAGLSALGEAERAHDGEPVDSGIAPALLTRARVDLLIAGGRGQQALDLLRAADLAAPLLAVPRARMRLLAGDHPGVVQLAEGIGRDASIPRRDRLELLLLQATAAWHSEQRSRAGNLMAEALELHRFTRIARSFCSIPAEVLGQLLAAAGEGLEPDGAARVATARSVYPDGLLLVELSDRERLVLVALARTASRQDIAESLYVSLNTVKSQLAGLYRKLDTTTREATLSRARQAGLLPEDAP
jgi:LuxR family transcriptional regulator, maltose regulon positive regulatory protein